MLLNNKFKNVLVCKLYKVQFVNLIKFFNDIFHFGFISCKKIVRKKLCSTSSSHVF